MDLLTNTAPIIACSSGSYGNNAVSLLRVSGKDYFEKINHLFSIDLFQLKPRNASFCRLVDKEEVVDEIVLTFFKGPNSYNGEDILELGVHGNVLNVERIIQLFSNNGISLAAPGEFTFRALRNKKMSLSQVEGLDLLLNANSIFSLNQGFSLLSGKLQKDYHELNDSFLNHKSAVELSIDFLDDVGEEQAKKQFEDTFNRYFKAISSLKAHVSNESLNLLSPEIALLGLPNAGKSSLFNLLLCESRAIVSAIAGTTRDYITEKIKIGETFFSLIDTAGIRKSDDVIESEGIKRSLDISKRSFFKILVINPFDYNLDYFKQLENIAIDLIIFSHSDKNDFSKHANNAVMELKEIINGPIEPIQIGPMGAEKSGPIEPSPTGPMGAEKSGPIEPSPTGPMGATINGSIGANLTVESHQVIESIKELVSAKYLKLIENEPVMIERHKDVINKIYLMSCDYSDLSSNESDISIISSELNAIGHCISELIGIVSPDDVLHNIFDNFCIGK
jgi:tRNA modification GTPase